MKHFISNRAKKPHNICDPASSSHHSSGMFHGEKKKLAISQLRLVGSHNTNLGAVAHGALELDEFQFGRRFLVTLASLDISSKKRCL